jgi:hypothetical protein
MVEALYSRSHSAANEVGRGYLFNGDTTEALVHFRRSLAISPHNANVARMVEKLEDSRRPLRFNPVGRIEFEGVVMRGREQPTNRALTLSVADSAGHWKGSVLWDGTLVPLNELVIGGDAIWATVDVKDQTLELKLKVSGDSVSGVWVYGWGNNGKLVGRKQAPPG